ncbi:MAG: hypothetical protein OXF61_09845 [Acidimicrobiaceae bacterium]|nr:hypothetical protein [Acidimicrobiaceae bacterium]
MTNAIGNPPVPNPTEHNQWYPFANSGSVTAVETTQGSIAYEQVVVGAGAWTPTHWEWLGGPSRLDYCATLGMLFKRLEDLRPYFKERRNGGIGAFTPDNVPVFDYVADNAWVIADSNHGFKMIGVGKLTAEMMVRGEKPDELKPFTLDRYRTGGTFGDRNSNCPWV